MSTLLLTKLISMSRKTPLYYLGKYKQIEAVDVVLDFQESNYNIGTAIVYLLRAGKKPNNHITSDLRKAIDHLQAEYEHQLRKQVTETTEGNHAVLYELSDKK